MSSESLPLRFVPTLAGATLAIAIGSLLLTGCAFALQGSNSSAVAVGGLGALWVFTAGCIYAANQQWIGRARDEQAERFVICLFIVVPILPVTILATAGLNELVGRPW